MSLWTAAEAARATGGEARGDWTALGVSIDTRTLRAGDLFVALSAARDGHEFVAQALEKGAAAALVSRVPENVPADAPLLVVPDVLRGLEALGRAARARIGGQIVAVTGSVGKTSTKEMLRTVIGGQRRVHAAEASYNNHWGVPLTLARMPRDTEVGIIEIGMNHPGEIAPLARLARPHVAMITTVGTAHLEAFDNIDGIAREKASIFNGLMPGGWAVINGDLDTTPILRAAAEATGAHILTFGEAPANHHRLTKVDIIDTATVAEARIWRAPALFKVAAAGRHFALNALGVLAVVRALGLDRALACSDLSQWTPPAGRGMRERLLLDPVDEKMAFELIDDAFNANPVSMAAALEVIAAARPKDNVGRHARGRRIAILGEMLELGPDELALHAGLADLPATAELDVVHCVGKRMRALYEALPPGNRGRHTEKASDLAAKAARLVDAGDVVLVKGSKGSKVSEVVDALRKLGHPAPDG
ncbi:UDP-N-acetylmuramoylalanyl-D-glutamyl-2,6-diaminopimelate--D-alanyl-D-alanine ligase [Pseudooceanicola batsensis HTCC2597]|uniref:UDP-N-acetylmuramoyl-tripeptide--D-alanyl-D-alanine ligase n=1 Tax=Pseudooceanicola batsensis (strain ATCC BAA-863 / DSM 15984 / KCTC 12145 / HTCC2597) TaxID=252305 RepID=A3TZB2_PSEBH|nr:UDP-N-acetylmuramoyl-tripeptide--D-alanyl-D-alanine ligase [Pseudooceanicola batsensis]EAQ02930.1 UDP-N-acetylmuramoylalanyl-D-glutamyl-2,6-diaminopimelate--D-alanyl-D-alanine ligase [Pseudooceanicola batsensis HTCC2597]